MNNVQNICFHNDEETSIIMISCPLHWWRLAQAKSWRRKATLMDNLSHENLRFSEVYSCMLWTLCYKLGSWRYWDQQFPSSMYEKSSQSRDEFHLLLYESWDPLFLFCSLNDPNWRSCLTNKEEERDKENWIKKSPLSCDLHVINNAHNLKPQEALQSSWVKRVLLRMVRIKASWSKRQRMFYVGYPHNLLVIIVSRASGNVDWADDDSLWRSILNYKHVKKLMLKK